MFRTHPKTNHASGETPTPGSGNSDGKSDGGGRHVFFEADDDGSCDRGFDDGSASGGGRPGNFTFTGTVLVPLNAGGATTVSFSGAGKFAITYAAECAEAGSPGNWVSLQILVDGVALDPTAGTSDAFCSGNSTAGFDGWATQSITVVTPALGTGGHTLQVQATDVGTAGGWLGDSSLVVQK